MSAHIVANEAKIPVELVKVDLHTHTTADGKNYYDINPKGYVPALEFDNGQLLTEAGVIIQYLADQKPEAELAPPGGTLDRYRLMEWITFVSSELHKGFGPLWNSAAPEVTRNGAIEKLQKRFTYLDQYFATHQFLMGEKFSVVDAYCFTILNWTSLHKVDISAHKNLLAYMERVSSRPAVVEAMKEEGLK